MAASGLLLCFDVAAHLVHVETANGLDQLLYRLRDHAKLSAFFSGVHKANRRFSWIDNVNRAAIGDVNAKRDFSPICDDTVAASELYVRFSW